MAVIACSAIYTYKSSYHVGSEGIEPPRIGLQPTALPTELTTHAPQVFHLVTVALQGVLTCGY